MRISSRSAALIGFTAVAVFGLAPLASAQTPTPTPVTPTPVAPPSIAQLCLATGIAEVDDLLDGVARSQLVGELSPLLTLVVPDRDTVEVDAAVSLEDFRKKLNCAPLTTPTPTPTPTVSPTSTPRPTTTKPAPVPVPDDGFGQVGQVPSGAAQTGGGPAE